MPTVKIYDIVTNDRYEFPVKAHLTGAKAVAKYIGVTEQKVRKYLHRNRFPKGFPGHIQQPKAERGNKP